MMLLRLLLVVSSLPLAGFAWRNRMPACRRMVICRPA